MSNRRFLHIYIASLLYPSAPISSPSSGVSFTKQPRKLMEQCCRNHCPGSWAAGCTMARMMNDIFVLPGILNEPLFSPHQLDPNSRNSFQSQTTNVGVAWRHIIFCEWAIISNEILPINPKPGHTARFLHLQLCPIDQYLACYLVLIGEGDGGIG